MSKNNELNDNHGIRVGRLDTIESIRNEMARLYRASRRAAGAEPEPAIAAKLAYLLNHIAKSIEGADLEKRIKLLEEEKNSAKSISLAESIKT